MAVDLMYQIETGNVTHHASTRIDVRWCYRYELEALLRVAGFSSVFAYGDYDQQPYEAESPRLVVEASRVGNTAGDADLN